ncbi:hypothetical protein ACH5RR_013119 [Cinchona calisaya]|uniref:Uncharacterized protein n=1 Tax=Cinchona calisaya TaxID=153742 RepID=A0ABD3A2S4_9GENT
MKGHATDNILELRHEIKDFIDKCEFIRWTDVEQAYDPSMNMISAEEILDNPLELMILESEIIEKFSQIHLRLIGKAAASDESKPMLEMVTKEEFLWLKEQLKNMQLVNETFGIEFEH